MDAGEELSERLPPPAPVAPDDGLRRMLKWVFVVLILAVLFALLVVELTIRWFA
jgi:hypothetical protein